MAVPRRVFMRQMRIRGLLCILIPMAEHTENQSNHGAQVDMRLPKSERLRHRAAVLRLFDKGRSEYAYPLRMIALAMPRSEAAGMFKGELPSGFARRQMMVTVPKKKFRHAVDRVWLRRRVREAYRLHRRDITDEALSAAPDDTVLMLAFIYVGAEKAPFATIEKKMVRLLGKAAAMLAPSVPGPEKKDEVTT